MPGLVELTRIDNNQPDDVMMCGGPEKVHKSLGSSGHLSTLKMGYFAGLTEFTPSPPRH